MSEVINIKLTDMQTQAVIDACKARAERIVTSPDMSFQELEMLGHLADALICIECGVFNADKEQDDRS
ncbi:MAG: hypothetical protein IKG21_06445 [Atopobiaceae bacterium]|nr:hypothetical protein [Atopobiaceae bacterium]